MDVQAYSHLTREGFRPLMKLQVETSIIRKRYSETCAGDLLGHIFWVSCDPRKVIEMEYGPNWHVDHPTDRFSWSSSHYNVKKAGKWSPNEMREVYKVYG